MRHVISLLWLLLLVDIAMATELAGPNGEVVLTISGNIEFSNGERGAEFDLDMLEQLEATSITTDTPWTDETTTFTGVRLSVLLETVGAQSASFRAIAVDNYWYDVNDIDFEKYPVVVAYKRNGEYMTTRSLGPLWIMFPFNEFPELLTERNKAACVWQLYLLVIQ